jgi:hypothetical protein
MRDFFNGFFKAAGKYDSLASDARKAIPALVKRYGLIGAGVGGVGGAAGGYLTAPDGSDTKTKLKRALIGGVGGALAGGGAGVGAGNIRGERAVTKLRQAAKATQHPWHADVQQADPEEVRYLFRAAKAESLKDRKLADTVLPVLKTKPFGADNVDDMVRHAEEYLDSLGNPYAFDLGGRGEAAAGLWLNYLRQALNSGKSSVPEGKLREVIERLEKEGIRDHKQFARKYHPDLHGGVSPLKEQFGEALAYLQAGKKPVMDDAYGQTKQVLRKIEDESKQKMKSTLEASPLSRYLDKYR